MEKLDSFVNMLTSLNTANDSRTHTFHTVQPRDFLNQYQLEDLYFAEGLARRAVDMLPGDMLSKGWSIRFDDDPDKALADNFGLWAKRVGLESKIDQALRMAYLYGGSGIVIGLRDGVIDPMEPVAEESIAALNFLVPLSCHQLPVREIGSDPFSPFFDKPTLYHVNYGERTGTYVHASRVLHFDGLYLPRELSDRMNIYAKGYGVSILQLAYQAIMNLSSSLDYLATLLPQASQAVFQMKGLMELAAAGEEGEKVFRARLHMMQMSRSVINALVLDGDEQFSTQSLSFENIHRVIEKQIEHLAAVTRSPVSKWVGAGATGLNSTGEGDARNWHEYVRAEQEAKLRGQLETLIRYFLAAKGKPDTGFHLEFFPLHEPTEAEQATTRKTQAETDSIYIAAGVLSPDEVASSRFGGEQYGDDIVIDTEARDLMAGDGDWQTLTTEEVEPTPEVIPLADLLALAAQITSGALNVESASSILSLSYPSISIDRIVAALAPLTGVSGNSPASDPATPSAGADPTGNDGDANADLSPDAMPEDVLPMREVARALGLSSSSPIVRLWKQGKIRAWKVGAKYYASKSEIEKATALHTQSPEPNAGGEVPSPDAGVPEYVGDSGPNSHTRAYGSDSGA